ncbi:unnamed protein product [Meloidogyne enterolobii]|uniref:Uncharacterized protein n=1 Tax=Meloidogyne enterolobii TaxID=390850 RepID=A0ACB0YZU3_MELEN
MTETFLFVYASAELILAAQIAISNFLVIFVYLRSKHIRTPTNAYIFSLALTDFLTGALGIPFTVASVLTRWPGSFYPCLAIHLILCVLCTVSTLHLLAMAVDKYLTICLRRFVEQRNSSSTSVRKTRAHFLIVGCWLIGTAIAGLPMVDGFGFASHTIQKFSGECHFTVVVDYRFLVFIIFFGTIILPSIVIAYCYISIYKRIRSEERQIKCLLRASERQRRISVRRKLIRILLILVLTYAFCWYPLYLINTVDLFLPPTYHPGQMTTLFAVVLSHLNCALNPLIYAYGMPGFKHSLRRFLPAKVKNTCTQQPVSTNNVNHVTHKNVIAQSFAVIPPMNSFGGGYGQPMGTKRIATTNNNNILNNNTIENNSFIEPKQSETKEDFEGKGELLSKEVVKNEPPQTPFPTLNKTSLSLLEMKRENFRLKSRIVFSSFDEQSPSLKHSSTFETEDNPSFNNSFEENNNKKVSFVKFKLEKHDECSPTCCDDEQTCLEEDKHNFKFELEKQSLPTCLEEDKHNFKFELEKQSLPTCCDEEEHNFKFDLEKQSLPTCCDEEEHNFKFDLEKQSLPTCCDEEEHNFKFDLEKQSLSGCCEEENSSSDFDELNNNKTDEQQNSDRKTSKMSTFSIRIFNGQWLVRKRGKKFSVREEANINENGK